MQSQILLNVEGSGYRLIADPNGKLKLPVIVLRGVPPAG
jgi:hypothetical protein